MTVINPGNQTGAVGTAVSLQIHVTDSSQTLAYSTFGLPAGLSINAFSGLISGTRTTAGTFSVQVIVQDGTGESGSASFTWTISSPAVAAGSPTAASKAARSPAGRPAARPPRSCPTGPHSGTYAARAGSTSPTNGDSNIAQTFTVPSGDATLSFWYNVTCPDTVTYDWATATLKDNTTGTTNPVLANTCVPSSGWKQVTAPVTAGHSYTLTLTSHDDNYAGDRRAPSSTTSASPEG